MYKNSSNFHNKMVGGYSDGFISEIKKIQSLGNNFSNFLLLYSI